MVNENNNGFWNYLMKKIKKHKDIISVIISLCILNQTILFVVLDEDAKVFLDENYTTYFIFSFILVITIFIGVLLYLHFNQLEECYEELNVLDSAKCLKRKRMLLKQKDYQKEMQIYLLSDIEKIEKNINNDNQIWVLTSDVKLETSNSTISETMENNLKKGVTYKYFVPDTIKNSASILELERKYKKYNTFNLIKMDVRYRFLFERFDVIIYSPDTNKRQGFICVNFSEINNLIAFKKFSEEDTRNLIGQLQKIRSV